MASAEEVRARQARAAKNQALFREVNERVKDINDHFHVLTALSDWVCECANDDCTERVELTVSEYEHVRRSGERFFVVPRENHVWPEAERVLERHATFWVVEKVELAAKIASDLDPRGRDGPTSLQV
jgi:hypothetical protein